jgi:hypothetical protein
MIFGQPTAYDSKHQQKLARCVVYAAKPATPAITFDRSDHPDSLPHPG